MFFVSLIKTLVCGAKNIKEFFIFNFVFGVFIFIRVIFLCFQVLVHFVSFPLTKRFLGLAINFFWIENKVSLAVVFVFLCVFFFSLFYIKEEKNFVYFIFVVCIFVGRMLILLHRGSVFFLFLGWDGLGISSFFLILYYTNTKSLNNSLFTLLRNRLGDAFFLIFLGVCLLNLWRFNIWFSSFFIVIIFFIRITKRAQTPISAWLPAAISAPTPVSALVHSSTLVTAGVILVIKFNFFLVIFKIKYLFVFIGLATIFVAGLTALSEVDFKKLVALRTLRQIGFLMFIFGFNSIWACFFHLIAHAFFKSCLFLLVGNILHFLYSHQDYRWFRFLKNNNLLQFLSILICLFCLCGLLFTRGFFSKDFFLDIIRIKTLNQFILFMFVVSIFLTYFYCLKLFLGVFYCSSSFSTWTNHVTLWYFFRYFLVLLASGVIIYLLRLNSLLYFSFLYQEKKIFLCVFFSFFFLCFILLYYVFFFKRMFFIENLLKIKKLKNIKLFKKKEKIILERKDLFFIRLKHIKTFIKKQILIGLFFSCFMFFWLL